MKHLIETADLNSLGNAEYDRLILNSTTNEIVYRGGVKYEYVDLGLPSGLKWAKCNVGAETETDYGDYFMWGSTKANTPDECTWAKAPFNNGSNSYNETYFNSVKDSVAPNGVLAKKYDAATQIMGGNWRMPTEDDFQELLANTTVYSTTINGTRVNKLISKTDNSKYIVIPVSNHGNIDVWSSSLSTSYSDYAYVLRFDSDEDIYANTGFNLRYKGIVVRGVRK